MSRLAEQARRELESFAYAFGRPTVAGRLRGVPEDFRVDEILGFEPDGDGEHMLIHIEKRGANTEFVARELGRLAGVKPVDVSYAGLKDRHAVTTQWFSVGLAGKPEPDWRAIESDEIRILSAARHRRKLRRGALRGNRFELLVRDIQGDTAELALRLEAVASRGVPNYFGEQRFGRGGQNLAQAEALFGGRRERDRHKRGLYLSAARSFLFNRVLSVRVAEGSWDRPIPGEVLALDGRRAVFTWEPGDEAVPERVARGEIHPTGPLWGRGASLVAGSAADLERQALAGFETWLQGLESAGMEQERRALRLNAQDLSWAIEGNALQIAFSLDAGSYATTVLRELVATAENGC